MVKKGLFWLDYDFDIIVDWLEGGKYVVGEWKKVDGCSVGDGGFEKYKKIEDLENGGIEVLKYG